MVIFDVDLITENPEYLKRIEGTEVKVYRDGLFVKSCGEIITQTNLIKTNSKSDMIHE